MQYAAFHTQRPGNYSICWSGQNKKYLATKFVMKTKLNIQESRDTDRTEQ